MMTVTNSTPIMSTKAETGDQNRAPGGVGGDQTQTPGIKDLPHTILAAKPCPIALPTQPTLGPHRPLIEEIRPNPIESPAVGKYLHIPCPALKSFPILSRFLGILHIIHSQNASGNYSATYCLLQISTDLFQCRLHKLFVCFQFMKYRFQNRSET